MSKLGQNNGGRFLGFDAPQSEGPPPEVTPPTSKKRVKRNKDEECRIVEEIHARVMTGSAYVYAACKAVGVTDSEYNGMRERNNYPTITELKKRKAHAPPEPKDELEEMMSAHGEVPFRSKFEQERDEARRERDAALQQVAGLTREIADANRATADEHRAKVKAIEEKSSEQRQRAHLQEWYNKIYALARAVCGSLPDMVALNDLTKDEVSGNNQAQAVG